MNSLQHVREFLKESFTIDKKAHNWFAKISKERCKGKGKGPKMVRKQPILQTLSILMVLKTDCCDPASNKPGLRKRLVDLSSLEL